MKKGIWVLAWVVAGLTSPVGAQEAGLPLEAQQMLDKAATHKSYRAQLVLEAEEEGGAPFRMEGKLLFAAPSKRRLEIREAGTDSAPQMLVNDGVVEWQHYPQAGVVYRLTAPPPTPGPHRLFAEAQPGTVRFIERTGSGGDTILRFEAKPLPASVEGSPVPIEKVRIDVGEKDGLVRQLALLDDKGDAVLTQKFSGIEVNVPTSDKDFAFAPPEGAAVVDMPPEGQAPNQEAE